MRAHTQLDHVTKFECATWVKLLTQAYANATVDNVTNSCKKDVAHPSQNEHVTSDHGGLITVCVMPS